MGFLAVMLALFGASSIGAIHSLAFAQEPSDSPEVTEGLETVDFDILINGRGRLLPYARLDEAGRKGTMGWVCESSDHQPYYWLPAELSDLNYYRILGFIRCITHGEYKRIRPRDRF